MPEAARWKRFDIAIAVTGVFVVLLVAWQYVPAPMCVSIVAGTSMIPTIEPGSVVFGVSTFLLKPRVGDIVIARYGNHYIVHRLVHVDGETAVTKGDANEAPDQPIPAADVRYVIVGTMPPPVAQYVLAGIYLYTIFAAVHTAYIVLNTAGRTQSMADKHVQAGDKEPRPIP